MNDTFSILLSFLFPILNLTHSLIGGLTGFALSLFERNPSIRWLGAFALIGIYCSYLFPGYRSFGLDIYPEIQIFLPLFATIGLIWSGIFKYRVRDADWRWLVLFPVVGVAAAVIYQSRGLIIWAVLLGSVFGGIAAHLPDSRFRSTLVFSSLGAMFTWTFPWGSDFLDLGTLIGRNTIIGGYPVAFEIFVFSLASTIGGVMGWFIRNPTVQWIIALTMLGMLVGSSIRLVIFLLGLLPVLVGGVVGGLVGLLIERRRNLLVDSN